MAESHLASDNLWGFKATFRLGMHFHVRQSHARTRKRAEKLNNTRHKKKTFLSSRLALHFTLRSFWVLSWSMRKTLKRRKSQLEPRELFSPLSDRAKLFARHFFCCKLIKIDFHICSFSLALRAKVESSARIIFRAFLALLFHFPRPSRSLTCVLLLIRKNQANHSLQKFILQWKAFICRGTSSFSRLNGTYSRGKSLFSFSVFLSLHSLLALLCSFLYSFCIQKRAEPGVEGKFEWGGENYTEGGRRRGRRRSKKRKQKALRSLPSHHHHKLKAQEEGRNYTNEEIIMKISL